MPIILFFGFILSPFFLKEESCSITVHEDKYGYKDEDNIEIIPAIFDSVFPFHNKLSRIQFDGLYGFLNLNGIEVIPPKYDFASDFRNGVAMVSIKGKNFYINQKNEQLTRVSSSIEMEEAKAKIVIDNKWGVATANGKIILPPVYDFIGIFNRDLPLESIRINDKWGLVDYKYNIIAPPKYDEEIIFDNEDLENDLIPVKLNGKFGYINLNGTEVISPIYDFIGDFSRSSVERLKLDEKWGLINKKGIAITKMIYQYIDPFVDNFANATLNGKQILIDKSGNNIDINVSTVNRKSPVIRKYDRVLFFQGDHAKVEHNGLWGLIDENGLELTPPIYQKIDFFYDKIAMVKKSGLWGYIDSLGKVIADAKYEYVEPFFRDGFAAVKYKGLYGYINKSGIEVIPPNKYEDARGFDSGFARVKLNGKWGLINMKGELITKIKYDGIGEFIGDYAYIRLNGKAGKIKKNGKEVLFR